MKMSVLRSCVSVAALAAGAVANPLAAQEAPRPATPAAAAADPAVATGLDEIVVTASGRDRSRLRSSISVSDVALSTVQDFTPHSEAEVLRLIPGIQTSGTAGPGGNANIGVRGIPVSTGGSEYVQLQEDGLPDVLFGDIQFGNNDYWLRFDNNVERVETVRGGSASTFASQGPGAIINYISKTGTKDGGEFDVSSGLNYREERLDFDYGAHLSPTLRFHIGGFLKDGSGPDHIGFTAEKGYQIKANVTQDFDDGKGYIRLSVKRLDDQEPTNTSQPSLATIAGGRVTRFGTLGPVDARTYSSAGIYNQNYQILNANGALQTVPNEGIHPKSTAFGGEFHEEFGDHFTVTDDFRYTIQSGVFANQWTTEGLTANALGKTVADAFGTAADGRTATIGSIVYAAGPNKGQLYTSPYINNGAQVYVTLRDTGSVVNNFVVDGKFDAGDFAHINARAGFFYMRQSISMDWRINNSTTSLNSASNNVPLDLFSGPNGTGTQLSANGQTGYNNQWGGCCGGRQYDLTYTDTAPFLQVGADIGGLNLDGSVRFDSVKASGNTNAPSGVAGTVAVTDALGTALLPTFNTSTTVADLLNYRKSYTSWSFGALYAFGGDTSVFARASKGGRFNADRLTYGGNYNADGSLSQKGNAISINFLTQQEVGVKNKGNLGDVNYNVEVTLFRSQLTENNYDFTLLSRNPPQNPNISNVYHSYGVEFVTQASFKWLRFNGFVTWTKPELVNLHTVPQNTPQLQYLLSPSVDFDIAALGVAVSGAGATWADNANTLKVPGSALVNLFAKVRPYKGLELGLNVNNLFNRLAYTVGGYIQQPLSPTSGIFDSSAVYGRTVQGVVRYRF